MKRFANLTREQLKEEAPNALAVFPLGAIEQHGPHLATGTDFYIAEWISEEAAAIASEKIPIILVPSLPFGASDQHLSFGGTLSISTRTYYTVIREFLDSLIKSGFTRIFLLNGHGGNHELIQLAARDTVLEHPIRIGAGSYWSIAWDSLVGAEAHRGRSLPGHAGDFETSIMMSLYADLVQEVRPHRVDPADSDPRGFKAPWRHEKAGFWNQIDGYTDSPAAATPERGKLFADLIVKDVAQAFIEFYCFDSLR